MGALYFFASHMVIRSMFYVGAGRSSEEVALFFLIVLGAIALVHIVPRVFLAVRLTLSGYIKVPAVSALATLGALLELLSILPAVGPLPFFIGGLLIGLSCGWLVTIWMSSFHVSAPDPLTFVISPALLCAVGFYFAFRVASSVSFGVAEGLLFALPLVSIACMVTGERDEEGVAGEEGGERRRASLVLVYVSASFALLSAVVVHIAGKDGLPFSAGLNYMVLFEILLVGVVLACCYLLHWFAAQRVRPRFAGIFVATMLIVPAFLIGVAMGVIYRPESVASLMWEISFWVMLVAVFAYDLRKTLFVGEGLAVGLMFEAMCVGQMTMQLVMHVGQGLWFGIVAGLLALFYLGGTFAQLLGIGRNRSARVEPTILRDTGIDVQRESGHDGPVLDEGGSIERDFPAGGRALAVGGAGEPDGADAVLIRCRELGEQFGLTQSEVRILEQLARGRTARYISDELGISFNTVRTHIRHVYEKMGIHSKQELIDLAANI